MSRPRSSQVLPSSRISGGHEAMARRFCALWLSAALALVLGGCATLSSPQREAAAAVAHAARSAEVDCQRMDACALVSPLREMASTAWKASKPNAPQHKVLILDDAPDALLARIHLIRSAQKSIDLQTYIFDEDDAAQLVLDELQAAAFRGVKIRILIDQLAALRKVETLAALTALHVNLELRVYNPVFDRARFSAPMYAVAALCCLRKLNRRMHNKVLVVDGLVGITGGRNYQDDYYDWGESFNFRDRDLLLAGPVVAEMETNFNAFWVSHRSVPAERLGDVARVLRDSGPPAAPHHPYRKPERVRALLADVDNAEVLNAHFIAPALSVGRVHYVADLPIKHRSDGDTLRDDSLPLGFTSRQLMQLIRDADQEVLLQTPYLVLSESAQQLFRELHQQADAPRVRISTNSLAATDAFITYAMSYKYKRRYLRDFGFEIHEFKPFPADAPFELGATGANLPQPAPPPAASAVPGATHSRRERQLAKRRLSEDPVSEAGRPSPFASSGGLPVRLKSAGMRMGLHAKSMVIDDRIGVVGSHNFDPRGDELNTEGAVVIEDANFAQHLAASILRDMAPGNAWTIARREGTPYLSGVEFNLAKLSEKTPIFDLWPIKYATSYDYVEGPDCPPTTQPQSPFASDFRRCNQPVGDFPEVDIGLKWLGVRLFTGFGAGLAPIL